MDGKLWTVVEGTLYSADPNTGQWERIGKQGEWGNTIALEAGNGFLWSLEQDGTLFKTDKSGKYVEVGEKGEYRGTKMLVSMEGSLYTVETGTMYRTR